LHYSLTLPNLRPDLHILKQKAVILNTCNVLVLCTTGIIPSILHYSLTLPNLRSDLHILMQKAVILNTCNVLRKFFGRTVNKNCLVSETGTVLVTS